MRGHDGRRSVAERASDDLIAEWRRIVQDTSNVQAAIILNALEAERAAVHAQYKAGYSAARRFYQQAVQAARLEENAGWQDSLNSALVSHEEQDDCYWKSAYYQLGAAVFGDEDGDTNTLISQANHRADEVRNRAAAAAEYGVIESARHFAQLYVDALDKALYGGPPEPEKATADDEPEQVDLVAALQRSLDAARAADPARREDGNA